MPRLHVPENIEAVIRDFYTCEFTTINKKNEPVTWPTLAYYHEPEGKIIVTASIAFPVKTYNAKRHPQVSLLYSDPTGTSLRNPPSVLVQGDAKVGEVLDNPSWALEVFKTSVRRQPESRKYISNKLTQRLFTFYFQRISMTVTPQRILAWKDGDFSNPPDEVEVRYVE